MVEPRPRIRARETLRVLHVSAGNLYGGIETFLATLARERKSCPQMVPEFAFSFDGAIARVVGESGAPVHILGAARWRSPSSILRARRALKTLLRSRRPDVVVCHGDWPHATFASVVNRAGIPLVYFRHGIGNRWHWLGVVAGRKLPTVVLSNSEFTNRYGHPRFARAPSRIVRCAVPHPPPPLAVDARANLRMSLGARGDNLVIIQVSRMESGKGHRLLLEALQRLPTSLPYKCWIVGGSQRHAERTYFHELKGEVSARGLDRYVSFLGHRNDVPVLMQCADILCQPNLLPESYGIVFVEAQMAGIPIVTTTSAGGALEIVDASCGLIVDPTGAALSSALRRLLTTPILRETLARGSSARAAESLQTADRLADLYAALAAAAS